MKRSISPRRHDGGDTSRVDDVLVYAEPDEEGLPRLCGVVPAEQYLDSLDASVRRAVHAAARRRGLRRRKPHCVSCGVAVSLDDEFVLVPEARGVAHSGACLRAAFETYNVRAADRIQILRTLVAGAAAAARDVGAIASCAARAQGAA